MPKCKESKSVYLRKLVQQYPDLKTDGSTLICNVCSKPISVDKKYNIKQHLDTKKHKDLKERESNKNLQQTFLQSSTSASAADKFCIDLCEAFISADIPIYKIRNLKIQQYLQNYTSFHIPSESSLRNKYIKMVYESTVNKIKKEIEKHFVWVSIDETTDASNRFVANVIVGILHVEEDISEKRFLINTVVLEKVNHSTIARLFDDSMKEFDIDKERILLFVSDAAPYMIKAAKAIAVFYPHITHVTCIAHGVHRVCEHLRECYSNVDSFIANMKKAFLKSPARLQILREMASNMPLPPQPVTTRWGTWIMAVNYYAKYFDEFVQILSNLSSTDSSAVRICQTLMNEKELHNQILFISANFGFLHEVITKLETKNLSLISQVNVVMDTVRKIADVPGDIGEKANIKFKSVLLKNEGFSVLKDIADILSGKPNSEFDRIKYTSKQLLNLKYAPLTSVDVERTFSMYKNVLTPKRQSFLFENLSQQFLIYCNNVLNE